MTSILTGFQSLDSHLGGLQPADLLLLAFPSSMRHASLALSIVLNVAVNARHRVGIFTPAMNKQHVVQKLLALSAGIDLHHIHTGVMHADDRNHLAVRARTLASSKVWIDDRDNPSVLQLQQRAQAIVDTHHVTFLLIDNIHCLRLCRTGPQHPHQIPEIGEISDALKMLATTLYIPILVLAPHTPFKTSSYEARTTSPQQSEYVQKKDADHVLFLYRENVAHTVLQEKHTVRAPLRIVSHSNGFVTDIALAS